MEIYSENLYREDSVMSISWDFYSTVYGLDFNLQVMKRDGLDYKGEFRDSLLSFYKVPASIKAGEGRLPIDASKYKVLCDDTALLKAAVLKNYDMMGLKEIPASGTLTINSKAYLRTFLVKAYYFAKSLELLMPKAEAVQYYQKLVDERTRKDGADAKVENVAEYLFKNTKMKGAFDGAFNYSECEPGPGRLAKAIKKCKWCEVLKEVNDPDYAYAIACHYDFEATKAENPAFALTRSGTLMHGKPYCDFLWHDTRIDQDLSHPPKEFWDALSAGQR